MAISFDPTSNSAGVDLRAVLEGRRGAQNATAVSVTQPAKNRGADLLPRQPNQATGRLALKHRGPVHPRARTQFLSPSMFTSLDFPAATGAGGGGGSPAPAPKEDSGIGLGTLALIAGVGAIGYVALKD